MDRVANTPYLIIAVVVTFEPDIERLEQQILSLSSQVNAIVIVDNSSSNKKSIERLINENIRLLELESNFGIAYAQNVGIELAVKQGASHILLMDQDSFPARDMVKCLISELESAGDMVAAAGPSYIDVRNNSQSFFITDKYGLPHRWYPNENTGTHVAAVFLIASGTLIKVSSLRKIGWKRSNYFIDHVDTEWSLRARSKGYKLLGVPQAIMHHRLGDEVKTIWFFGKRQVSYHSPLRDYYMFRNTLLMLRDLDLSIFWQLHLLWRLIQFTVYFLLFAPRRLPRARLMGLGLWHGLKGVSGKLNVDTGQCSAIPTSTLDPEKLS